MTAHAQQLLANTFNDWSDAVCEAIGRLEDKRVDPPAALFPLDAFLKSDRLKLAVLALHREAGGKDHGCCFHIPNASGPGAYTTHLCCLPDATVAAMEALPVPVGEWVLTKTMGDKVWFLAKDEELGYGWTVPNDPGVLRFADENCARLYRSWHHRGDTSITAERLVVGAT